MKKSPSKRAKRRSAFVYFIVSGCGRKVKIGSSLSPLSRIASLRRTYPDVDLVRSVLLEVDSTRLEFVLHYALSAMRLATEDDDERDGRTEWFDISAMDAAIHLTQEIFRSKETDLVVTKDLLRKVDEHVLRYGDSGRPKMSREERAKDKLECHVRALKEADAHAEQFISVLAERRFDERLSFGDSYYLRRKLNRHSEAEYFDPALAGERWIDKLLAVHACCIQNPYFSYTAQRIKYHSFEPINPSEGIETIDFGPFYSAAQGWLDDERVLRSEAPILTYLLTEYPYPTRCELDPLPSVRIITPKTTG